MKRIGLVLGLLLVCAVSVSAQVSMEVLMNETQFLPGESVPVRARVINNSGQTLSFGDEHWLSYSVEAEDGTVVLKTGNVPEPHGFQVKATEMATAHADLAPCFNLSKPGRYHVTASAFIKDWGREVTSDPVEFYVISGSKLWEQEFGLPQSPTNHNEPEARKYILQQATLVDRMKLYLRVTDAAETRAFKIYCIGPMIGFAHPQVTLDKSSNLHLLYQQGAQVFSYQVFNPDGGLALRRTYFYANSPPHLRMAESGYPVIVGGIRHVSDMDVPSPKKPLLTNELAPPASAP